MSTTDRPTASIGDAKASRTSAYGIRRDELLRKAGSLRPGCALRHKFPSG